MFSLKMIVGHYVIVVMLMYVCILPPLRVHHLLLELLFPLFHPTVHPCHVGVEIVMNGVDYIADNDDY